jgi:hypothetical protein
MFSVVYHYLNQDYVKITKCCILIFKPPISAQDCISIPLLDKDIDMTYLHTISFTNE